MSTAMSTANAATRTTTAKDAAPAYDVIVIGSGMGGLTAATLLARLHGKKVLVLERHFRAGGFTHVFARKGGWHWDVGVHYVGEMQAQSAARQLLDVVTGGAVQWQPMPEVYDHLVFPGFEFPLRAGKENFRADLLARFPHEAAAIHRYFADVERAASYINVLGMRGAAPALVVRLVEALRGRARKLALRTTADWLNEHVRDEQLRAVLGARWGDFGLPPAQSAFLAHAVIARHYFEGGYYPVGSSARIAEGAAEVLHEHGGAVRVRAEVERILVENGRAVGVRLQTGEELRAKVIISNAGARNTFLRLVPDEVPLPFRDELRATPPSMGTLTLFLGLRDSAATLGLKGENYWLHDALDHDAMAARAGELAHGHVPHLYLSFPSLKDPQARAHTAEVITSIDASVFERWTGSRWKKRGEDYEALKAQLCETLLAAVERRFPGFRALVAYAELATPLTTETFTAHPRGEIYGLPATPERFRRPYLQPRTPLPGLFLTGADALMLGVVGAAMAGLSCTAAVAGPLTYRKVAAAARQQERRVLPPTRAATSPSSV